MRRGLARLLYTLAFLVWMASWPILFVSSLALALSLPFRWLSERCLDKAREWDPRLTERGEHADLHAPPGA